MCDILNSLSKQDAVLDWNNNPKGFQTLTMLVVSYQDNNAKANYTQ